MRKNLLSAVLTITAINVNALEAPEIKLGGRMDFMAGVIKESAGYRTPNPAKPISGQRLHDRAFVNDTKLDINIDGKINKEMKYGGFIRLHADTSKATNGESTFGDKTMVYFQHGKIGRLEGGNMPGAGGMFEMSVPFLGTGMWGVEGFWSQLVQDKTKNFATISNNLGLPAVANTRGVEFITSPSIISNYSGNHYSDAPKVNFYTKPHESITIGVAYIPDMDSTGTVAGVAGKNRPPLDVDRPQNPASFRNIISGGIMLDHALNEDYRVKASFVGETGKAKANTLRNLKAMEAGFALSYRDITAVGSFGNWFKSFTLKNPAPGAKQGGEYYTLGLGQKIDKFSYGVTYLNSKRAGGLEVFTTNTPMPAAYLADKGFNRLNVIAFDAEYKVAPGFLPYANVTSFNFKEAAGFKDRGNMFVLGTRLLF